MQEKQEFENFLLRPLNSGEIKFKKNESSNSEESTQSNNENNDYLNPIFNLNNNNMNNYNQNFLKSDLYDRLNEEEIQDTILKNKNTSNFNNTNAKNTNNNLNPVQNRNLERNENPYNNTNSIIAKTCLINDENKSYLNAILQCLINIKSLKEYFTSKKNVDYLEKKRKEFRLSFATSRVFYHSYIQKDKFYFLQNYSIILGEYNPIYKSNKSRSPNECLNYILEKLSEELNTIIPSNDRLEYNDSDKEDVINSSIIYFKNINESIISSIFNWFEFKEFHCSECGDITYEFKNFNSFQLDTMGYYNKLKRNNINIIDCINFDFKKTIDKYCKICRKRGKFSIFSSIYKLPQIFIFFLDIGEDINFSLDEEINLKRFCQLNNVPSSRYELIGIISKKAKCNTKYVSFTKSFEDQKWYCFDEKVEIYEKNQVIFDNNNNDLFIPCILFYKLMEK